MKININNEAARVDRAYIGVDNAAREVDRIYVGVDGVAREVIFGGFDRHDIAEANITSGDGCVVQLQAKGVEDFRDIVMSLRYDHNALLLERLSADPPSNADLNGQAHVSNAQIVSQIPGRVDFRCIREMRPEKEWSGFIVYAHFQALTTGTTNIQLS